jgi:alpha-ketoglutarate-dependent taurine dioxygenase
MQIQPLDTSFGAIVTGVNLDKMDEQLLAAIHESWLEYGLLIFPGQFLTHAAQIAFARNFGELEIDLAAISNLLRNGKVRDDLPDDEVLKVLKGNMGWHMDSTYMPVQATGAVFTAHVVPEKGGETAWADMRAAYDALSAELRDEISGLKAYHSLYYSQQKAGFGPAADGNYIGYGFNNQEPPLRSLVKVHPETGRPNLVIGRHAYGIVGLSAEASERLLTELLEFSCQAPRVYQHSWQEGDAVLWDNRRLMHRACPWNWSEPRVMYHTRIAGDPASECAAAV